MYEQMGQSRVHGSASGTGLVNGRADQGLTVHAGRPPRLRGLSPTDLECWAIACRASAAVLDREGHPGHAAHLRYLAQAGERRAARLIQAEANFRAGSSRAA